MEEKLTITAIEPQKKRKDRYNIFADGEYVASLGAETVVRIGIKTGGALSRDILNDAVMADNAQYAFDRAVVLLSHSMRTRGELKTRLYEKGIPDAAIEAALDKLAAYGYVNDSAYAKEYVQSAVNTGRWGRIAVAHRLKEKGLAQDIIDEAMSMYTGEDEEHAARRQLDSLRKKAGGDARKLRQAAFAALARHGFSYDIINALFSEADD